MTKLWAIRAPNGRYWNGVRFLNKPYRRTYTEDEKAVTTLPTDTSEWIDAEQRVNASAVPYPKSVSRRVEEHDPIHFALYYGLLSGPMRDAELYGVYSVHLKRDAMEHINDCADYYKISRSALATYAKIKSRWRVMTARDTQVRFYIPSAKEKGLGIIYYGLTKEEFNTLTSGGTIDVYA